MSATAVVKTRFPADTVANLDRLAREIGAKLRRKVDVPSLAELFGLDRVRRGPAPGPRKARQA